MTCVDTLQPIKVRNSGHMRGQNLCIKGFIHWCCSITYAYCPRSIVCCYLGKMNYSHISFKWNDNTPYKWLSNFAPDQFYDAALESLLTQAKLSHLSPYVNGKKGFCVC